MSKRMAKKVLTILENAGKVKGRGRRELSISAAMKAVGYSPGYVKNPQDFTNTKTWKELIKRDLPDELVSTRLKEQINASSIQHYIFPRLADKRIKVGKKTKIVKNELTNEEVKIIVESVPGCRLIYVKRDYLGAMAFFEAPDHLARDKAIEKMCKIKGYYAPEKFEDVTKRKYQDLSDAELAARIKKARDLLLKR